MARITSDFEAFEAIAWAHIADCAAQEAAVKALVSSEATQRAWISHEGALTLAALADAWVVGAVRTAHRIVERSNAAASAAASEALAWRAVSRAAQQQSEEVDKAAAAAAPRSNTEAKARAEEESEARRRVNELLGQRSVYEADVFSLESTAQTLKINIESSRRELADLRRQLEDEDAKLHNRRTNGALDLQAAERELQDIRAQTSKERTALANLKAETAAAELSSAARSRQRPAAIEAVEAAPPPTAPAYRAAPPPPPGDIAGIHKEQSFVGGPMSPTSPGGSMQRTRSVGDGQRAELQFGLAALQSVREQLREIRDEAGSPRARVASPDRGGIVFQSSANLSASPSAVLGPHSPTGLHSAGGSAVMSSPWRARLTKLQEDLKVLRTDLNTTGPAPSPAANRTL